jgi:hypothetical protein
MSLPQVRRNAPIPKRNEEPELDPLERLSKNELYEIANEADIVGRSSMTKAELIQAIKGE